MPPAKQPGPAARPNAYMVDVRTLAALGVAAGAAALLIGFYLWMVRPAAAREIEAACEQLKPAETNPRLGAFPTPAPDFEVVTHDGKKVKLSDFRGRVVLLNFWASWCDVCKAEKPSYAEMARDMAGDDYVTLTLASNTEWASVLLALSLSHNPGAVPLKWHAKPTPPITMEEAMPIYQRALPSGTPYKVVLDPPDAPDESNIGAIATAWGIKAVPESFLIDRLGRIRFYFVNKRNWDSAIAKTCVQSVIDE
jgi:thiol-disulfide isomerase/thioredoxin